jgi:hypothetical protein
MGPYAIRPALPADVERLPGIERATAARFAQLSMY